MDEELLRRAKAWLKDFEATYPKNLCSPQLDDDTFEGSAYALLSAIVYQAETVNMVQGAVNKLIAGQL